MRPDVTFAQAEAEIARVGLGLRMEVAVRITGDRHRIVGPRCDPFQQFIERRAESLAPGSQTVLNLWRDLVMNHSAHDAVGLQLT